ncbi:Lcl C-terminal domain-containing protein [Pseudomonas mohnii]
MQSIYVKNLTLNIHSSPKAAMPALAVLSAALAAGGAMNPETPSPTDIPAVGQSWPGQGGINGGLVPARGDVPEHYLIIAAADVGDHEWGGYREESKATSKTDGKANTEWLCNEEAQHPAANACAEYKADGHHDFYLPAAAELYHCWVNCPEVFAQDCYYWSSSQRSADYAFGMYFGDGVQDNGDKDDELRVRPVRRLFI